MKQECLTLTLTLITEVSVSACNWVQRIVAQIAMAETIARLRMLGLNFAFIIRSFFKQIYLHTIIGSGQFDTLLLLCAIKGFP